MSSENQQNKLDLSILTIWRLGELLRTVENEGGISQKMNRRQELKGSLGGKCWTANACATSLVVAPEHADTARQVIVAIGNAVLKFASGQDCMGARSQAQDVDPDAFHSECQIWTLGTVVFCLEQRPILRGEIELRNVQPIAPNIPDWVVQYLVSVPGIQDQITREIHGHWGYHYHYLDSSARRSDTLLTFDQRLLNTGDPVLCRERHAAGEKFKARADLWGNKKCKSIYDVCHPDTLRFALAQFKRPAADAMMVWP